MKNEKIMKKEVVTDNWCHPCHSQGMQCPHSSYVYCVPEHVLHTYLVMQRLVSMSLQTPADAFNCIMREPDLEQPFPVWDPSGGPAGRRKGMIPDGTRFLNQLVAVPVLSKLFQGGHSPC